MRRSLDGRIGHGVAPLPSVATPLNI
jgi:hypothetical protein